FGVISCQPAFETACKPKIVFINDDPNGRGKVFTNVVPDVDTTEKDIACTACSILYRDPSEIPQNERPTTITLHLQAYGGVAQTGNATIQFDLDYINSFANQTAAITKQEMLGVLQHETVHIYQNYGNTGTGEGMADLVRTRTGYYQRNRWVKGGSWKDPYTNSGFFYSWLTGPCAFHSENYPAHDLNLPYKLNKVLAGTSGDAAFTAVDNLLQQTFGKNADTLWTQYQNTAF
ncbi:MAG TPA: basic secretory protein-like protein, partial [Polyangiaceae bacterium]